jgi:hypothetical protein
VLATTTCIEHDPRGVDWALFMNASLGKPEGPELHREFLREIHGAIVVITSWPELDLFDRYR